MDPRRHLRLAAVLLAGCAAAPPPAPRQEPPPAPGPPGGTPLEAAAREARAAVERLLGASVPGDAAVPRPATREELEAALVEELRPQAERLHRSASPAALETLLRATARSSAASVAARYSPSMRRILVAEGNLAPQAEAAGLPPDPATARAFLLLVLAHEMVHAADDAGRGLAGLFREAPDAEAVRAAGMVVEGRAVHYARRAAAALAVPEAVAAVLPGGRGPPDERRARWLLTYRHGAAFVADLERRGGTALAGRPLRDPPRRTSTVFHPERYGEGGEERAPDLAAALAAAGFPGAGEASELDLRARWLPAVGEEAVARAFRGFRAGAGIHRPDGGVSVSIHDTIEDAGAYAAALRSLYGVPPAAEEGERDGLAVAVLVRGRAVGSAARPDRAAVRREAEAALGASAAR